MDKDTPDTSQPLMERRAAIKQLAMMCGLALSTQSLSLMAADFSLPIDQSRKKQGLLTGSQRELVKVLGELIMPTTDTPGAIAAGVHDFIHYQLAYCFDQAEQQQILDGLAMLDEAANQRHKLLFVQCDQTRQIALLRHMEAAGEGFREADRQFFKQFKALVMFGYYTSEIGASQELAYLPIPGGYRGDFKFSETGKAWAS